MKKNCAPVPLMRKSFYLCGVVSSVVLSYGLRKTRRGGVEQMKTGVPLKI
ncbi:MAG: hypothetical protein Q4F69_09510 [Bacteroidia bacterium]|nr:hypothetical protein [Bacteroidia bacterium]